MDQENKDIEKIFYDTCMNCKYAWKSLSLKDKKFSFKCGLICDMHSSTSSKSFTDAIHVKTTNDCPLFVEKTLFELSLNENKGLEK